MTPDILTALTVLDVLEYALRATLGTLWFILGLVAVMLVSPGRFHL